MGYTNKTSHYELPQYVANDKPSWLGDFNAAMLKIDTAMADNDATAEAANSAATGAQTQVAALSSQLSTIQGQVNTAVDTATTADGKATTAQTVAGEANTNASEAKTLAGEAKTLAQAAKQTADNALPIGGGTMSGDLILNGAPTTDNQAATKAYVDANAGNISSSKTLFKAYVTNATLSGSINAIKYGDVLDFGYKAGITFKGTQKVGTTSFTPFAVGYSAGNPFNLDANKEYKVGHCEYTASGSTASTSTISALYDGTNTYLGVALANVGDSLTIGGCGIINRF